MGIFGQGKTKIEVIEAEESAEARKELLKRGQESVQFPTRQIADLSAAELEVEQRARAIIEEGPSEARQQALDLALEAAQPRDITQDPVFQAVQRGVVREGQLESNRLGRAIQLRGGAGSTAGRDILARNVTGIEANLLAAAAPFLFEARASQERARGQVSSIVGEQQRAETSRLGLGSAVGALRRDIEQARTDANFQRVLDEINFRFGTQANLLGATLTTPATVVSGGAKSIFEQIVAPISQVASKPPETTTTQPQTTGGGGSSTGAASAAGGRTTGSTGAASAAGAR